MRQEARERANGAAAALEERTAAAVLALEGVRAAYDASPSVVPTAFSTFARVPLARTEVIAVGWAPRVAASQRTQVEASEQVRISAPANALTTYPLSASSPPPRPQTRSTSAPTRRSPPPSGSHSRPEAAALRSRPRSGRRQARRLRLRPVFGRGLPLRTPVERREALTGSTPVLSPRTRSSATPSPASPPGWTSASPTDPPSSALTRRRHHRPGKARRPNVARPSRTLPRIVHRPGGRGVRGTRLDDPPRRRVDAPAPPRGVRSGTRDHACAGALDLRIRARPRRDEGRRGAGGPPTRRRRHRCARARGRQGRRRPLVLPRSRAAAGRHCEELIGLEAYSLLHPDDLLTPANGPQRYARKDGSYVVLEGRSLTRPPTSSASSQASSRSCATRRT